jgi:hypothetical protein
MRLRQVASIAATCLLALAACGDDGDDTRQGPPTTTVTLTVGSFACHESPSPRSDAVTESSATRPWVDFCRRLWETGRFGGPPPTEFSECIGTDVRPPGQLTALVLPAPGACPGLGLTPIEGG